MVQGLRVELRTYSAALGIHERGGFGVGGDCSGGISGARSLAGRGVRGVLGDCFTTRLGVAYVSQC